MKGFEVFARVVLLLTLISAAVLPAFAGTESSVEAQADARERAAHVLQNSPAVFVENMGQWPEKSILFALPGSGANVGVTDSGLRFQLFRRENTQQAADKRPLRPEAGTIRMTQFRMSFAGARAVTPSGENKSAQVFNYHHGDRSLWRDNVAGYETIQYSGIYDGIDLRMMGRANSVKYEFHVAPGATWHRIALRYDGIEGLSLREDGALEIKPAAGWPAIVDSSPYLYQDGPNGRQTVAGKFRLIDATTLGFEVTGGYDASRPLVIDPELAWSSYVGGTSLEAAGGIATDQDSNVFVAGTTMSPVWFPAGLDSDLGGGLDAIVAKIAPNGSLIWTTYIGGAGYDMGYDIAADASGNLYLTGCTDTANWLVGGYDTSIGSEYLDAFAVKLSPAGTQVWGTLLGGTMDDVGLAIALAPSGAVIIGGQTESSGWFPTGNDTTPNGATDGFLAALSATGQQLLWCTYLGGGKDDLVNDVAVDAANNIYLAGTTRSPMSFSGGYDAYYDAGMDGFVCKYTEAGVLVWGSYLGGNGNDEGLGVAADASGNVYVSGYTSSAGWVSGGIKTTYTGSTKGYVVKLTSAGAHAWSTYIGGSGSDTAYGIITAGPGSFFIVGDSSSKDWITGGSDTTLDSGTKGYVAKFSLDGQPIWSSYIGGGSDYAKSLAMDTSGSLCVAGETYAAGWTAGGYDTSYDGSCDLFVVKFLDNATSQTGSVNASLTPPEAVTAGAQWRIAGTETWFDSGTTQTGVVTGARTIEFKTTPGWATPPDQIINVVKDCGITATAAYTRAGSLTVKLEPSDAVAHGAQWRRVGTQTWLNGSFTETNVSSGTCTVEFKPVDGWATPANLPLTVAPDQNTSVTATYASVQSGLSWSTYTGVGDKMAFVGNEIIEGYINDVAVDADRNIYVTGTTSSSGWVYGGYDTTFGGGSTDAFVTKISSTGQFLWSSYLGGSGWEYGFGVAIDGNRSVYITGETSSDDGWVSGAYNTTYNGGTIDGFIVKLNSDGTHAWSGYLGGTGLDAGYGLDLDSSGSVFVTGMSYSATSGDVFVAKLDATGQKLWLYRYGGSSEDLGMAIQTDSYGYIYVAGSTMSSDWLPGTFNGGVPAYSMGGDAFILKLTSSGGQYWGKYLGGTGYDYGHSMAFDGQRNIYVVGSTQSSGWVSGGFNTTFPSGTSKVCGFLVKMNNAGTTLWSTYLGNGSESASDVAVDAAGNACVVGGTGTAGWLTGGYDTTISGSDGYLIKVSSLGQQVWGTYLGGLSSDGCSAIAIDNEENLIVSGSTSSSGWISGGYDTSYNSISREAYVAKLHGFGSLRVTIDAEATGAGGMWRPVGTTTWLSSGATLTKVPTGAVRVEYKPLTSWTTPDTATVKIADGQLATLTGTYTFVRTAIPARDWIHY